MNSGPQGDRNMISSDPVRDVADLVSSGRLLEAESVLIECSESSSLSADTICNLAQLALEMQKPDLARELLEQVLKAAPRSPAVRFLAGIAERLLGNPAEAKAHLQLAQPTRNPDAAYNLSLVHEEVGEMPEARSTIDLALRQSPQDADYLNQSACVAAHFGDFDQARTLSGRAHAAEPQSPGFAFNHAQNLLLAGRADEAWPLFDARFAFTPEHLFPENGSAVWQGEALTDQSILVWHEQGLGDSIHFSRYLPILAARAKRVVFRCQADLIDLLGALLPGIEVVAERQPLPQTDFHVPLLSLPGHLGGNLLEPPASLFPQRTSSGPVRKVGFAHAGNPRHPEDSWRSIPFSVLDPLIASNFDWVCLQKELPAGESLPANVSWPAQGFRNFSDTAEAISHLDLIVSVDTAVAHLAASLGKPTWILLPICPDWRWGVSGEQTPWYPSARLFRQTAFGEWDPVIHRVREELVGK